MKLINITTRYYIILFLIVLSVWSVVFYFIMKFEVYQNSDEVLYNRAHNISLYLKKNPSDIKPYPLADYTIHKITQEQYTLLPREVFSDTLVYEPTDEEFDEYRKLDATFKIDSSYVKIIVIKARLESTEIFNTIGFTLIPLSGVMILILTISARFLNRRLWSPFYRIVDFLANYSFDKQAKLPKGDSTIDEFKRLEESLQTLILRNRQVFQEQKQFIENASHETQTPLAVIQSQLEIFLQMSNLSSEQAEIIHSALKETDRLTKLNKTLLLLSKIENQQFIDKSPINLEILTKKLIEYFDEKKEKLNLNVQLKCDAGSVIHTNSTLAEVLVGNLLKNAFTHNLAGGDILIKIDKKAIQIDNTGPEIREKARIFDRFHNRSTNGESWGLGLSIAKKIADINNWKISYDYKSNRHSFRVKF